MERKEIFFSGYHISTSFLNLFRHFTKLKKLTERIRESLRTRNVTSKNDESWEWNDWIGPSGRENKRKEGSWLLPLKLLLEFNPIKPQEVCERFCGWKCLKRMQNSVQINGIESLGKIKESRNCRPCPSIYGHESQRHNCNCHRYNWQGASAEFPRWIVRTRLENLRA